jgi:hypothetical protein
MIYVYNMINYVVRYLVWYEKICDMIRCDIYDISCDTTKGMI